MTIKQSPPFPPTKKHKKAKSSFASLPIALQYDTASSLHHLMCAQLVHAQYWAENGHPALLDSFENLKPLFDRLGLYLDNPARK